MAAADVATEASTPESLIDPGLLAELDSAPLFAAIMLILLEIEKLMTSAEMGLVSHANAA